MEEMHWAMYVGRGRVSMKTCPNTFWPLNVFSQEALQTP
jgi:hypothetical protein